MLYTVFLYGILARWHILSVSPCLYIVSNQLKIAIVLFNSLQAVINKKAKTLRQILYCVFSKVRTFRGFLY